MTALLRSMEESKVKMHGRLGEDKDWLSPECVTEFDVNARLSFTSIKAHEYCDRSEVLHAKVVVLAELIKKSKSCMAFTGAGISTSAGIDDYATKAKEDSITSQERPKVKDWKDARPTRAHRVMATMYDAGYLHYWVQQNHDSLPQKAGYPQHALNEIHGSLHDPANSIVPYEGSLRDDLFTWMHEWELKNDLCLALGTSLSGFNVDSIAETSAQRCHAGKSLGLVIVNLQQTPYDDLCSLRIFAKIDDVMNLLAEELGIADQVKPMDHELSVSVAEGSRLGEDLFSVPFAESGCPSKHKMEWDLREGRRVKLTGGPYAGDIGRMMGKNDSGHYRIRFEDSINPQFNVKRRPFSLWLGSWWLTEVTHGFGITPGGKLPFVNVPDEPEKSQDRVAVTAVPAIVVPRPRPSLKSAPPPPPPRRSAPSSATSALTAAQPTAPL